MYRRFILSFVIALILAPLSFRIVHANELIFADNFDNNNISNWNIISNTCLYNGQPSTWETNNGQLGIQINGKPCSTFLMPQNVSIDSETEYIVSVDIQFATSLNMDRNFIVKFQDLANWYGMHFIGSNIYLDKVVNGNEYFLPNKQFNYPFVENQTYNIRVHVLDSIFEIYINDQLVHTITDASPTFTHTTAGLAASAGGAPISEVWFDNFKLEEVSEENNDDIILDVPNLKQNAPQWGNLIYNNYPSTATHQTIRKWGCYLTSAAMLLQFHDFNVDPGQLNTFLKTNNGFNKSHGVDLSTVAAYTKVLNPTIHLEYKYKEFSNEALDAELLAGRPVIVKLQGNDLIYGSHFVVVTGKQGNEYLINDPEPTSTKTKLSEYSSDLYNHIRTLVPASTNFSYINIYSSLNVIPHVYRDSGEEVLGFNYIEAPLSADDESTELAGKSLNVFSYPQPSSGNYTIKFLGYGKYEAEIKLYNTVGNLVQKDIQNFRDSHHADEIQIEIGSENKIIASVDSIVTYLNSAYEQGMIKNKAVYKIIKSELLLANYFQHKNRIIYKASLKLAVHHIQKYTPKYIKPEASEKLINDIDFLLAN